MDDYMYGYCVNIEPTPDIATCPVSVWRLERSEGMSFKKSLFAEEQSRPKVARRRQQWKKE